MNSKLKDEFIIANVVNAFKILENSDDLSPNNPVINKVLGSLVKTLSHDHMISSDSNILDDDRIKKIHGKLLEKLSISESEMEKFWAKIFINKENLKLDDLQSFWYWNNYQEIIDYEIKHIDNSNTDIAFLGSGPLPLSPIIMYLKTGKNITCIDNDREACELSQKIIDKLGLNHKIKIVNQDAIDHKYSKYDLVFIASLIPNKEDLVHKISKNSNPDIAIRSCEKLHRILYKEVDKNIGKKDGYKLNSKTSYKPNIINTTLFFKRLKFKKTS